MEGVNNWAMTVIVCAVMVSIAGLLPWSKGMEKTVRTVLGAFMLCAVIIPFGSGFLDEAESLPEISVDSFEQKNNMDEIAARVIKNRVGRLITARLAEKGIAPDSVRISLSANESGSINKITAAVYLDSADSGKSSVVRELIENELGIECRIMHNQ